MQKKQQQQQLIKVVEKVIHPNQKAKRKNKKQKQVRRSALSQSPYFQTLLAPWKVQGVKIPDMITVPSFTVQQEQRWIVNQIDDSVGSSACAGIAVILGSEGSTSDYYQITALASGVFTWTGATLPSASDLTGITDSIRVVSAGLTCVSNVDAQDNSGNFVASYIPGGNGVLKFSSSWNIPTTTALCLAEPYVTTVPFSKGFAEVRYIPPDPLALTYKSRTSVPQRTDTTALYGALMIVCSGLKKGAGGAVEFCLYQNLECQALKSQMSFTDAEASYSDPIEMAIATNAVASTPEFPVIQSLPDTLAGQSETWVPQSLMPSNKYSFGKPTSQIGRSSNLVGLAPLAAGFLGYTAGKGTIDKIPILGSIMKTMGGLI